MKLQILLSSVLCGLLSASLSNASAQSPAAPQPTASTTPAAAPPSGKKGCTVIRTKPSPEEALLAKKSYKDAEAAYRTLLEKEPESEEARLGLVRAFIGQDKVTEAQAEAGKLLAAHPKSALAEVASSEADFRAANVQSAFAHARAAIADDPCEARAAVVIADLYDLNGYYAHSARLYETAHKLRPTDELILREWIDSLPRKRRQEELAHYLEGDHALSQEDSRGYDNEMEHLKARRPGECRVISHSEKTAVPMRPVYGDNPHPTAFGLDVLFNGKRHRVQIDTGASGIVLTQSAARDLKLEPEYKIKTGGVGDEGELNSYLTHVHSIRIGDVEVSDCMVEVVQKSKLDVDGLIGMDVFRKWLVTLDYQNAELRLGPLPSRPGDPSKAKLESDPLPSDVGDEEETPQDRYIAPDMKDWEQVLRIGHEILLPAQIKNGPTHYLIMDTGASLSNFSPAMAREGGKLHGDDSIHFVGLSGEVRKVYSVDQVPLRVANLVIPASNYFAYDITQISHHSDFEISGLLGLPTLQRLTITIDYRDNLLKLTYDPKHDLQRF